MSRPDWQEVFDSGPGKGGKRAVAVRYGPDGQVEVLGVAEGAEAEAMVAQAREQGLEVKRDTEQVDDLFRSHQPATRVPPEVYELMSLMVEFAQEVDEVWEQRTVQENGS